ncbi:hypothetical protein CLAIMM_14613 [Cladophialophora immunda]|nr:hypothetical protein CLAIMM_14613 [Cladophialophora immunda]
MGSFGGQLDKLPLPGSTMGNDRIIPSAQHWLLRLKQLSSSAKDGKPVQEVAARLLVQSFMAPTIFSLGDIHTLVQWMKDLEAHEIKPPLAFRNGFLCRKGTTCVKRVTFSKDAILSR